MAAPPSTPVDDSVYDDSGVSSAASTCTTSTSSGVGGASHVSPSHHENGLEKTLSEKWAEVIFICVPSIPFIYLASLPFPSSLLPPLSLFFSVLKPGSHYDTGAASVVSVMGKKFFPTSLILFLMSKFQTI